MHEQMFMEYFNTKPTQIKGTANSNVQENKRLLYTKLFSCYEFTLPETWALNWFRFWLFVYGSIGVVYTKELGWIAQPYSIEQLDWQFQPWKIYFSNTFLKTEKRGIVGVNAGIVHIMDDYYGLDDLVTKYAVMLSECEKSININLMNANVALFAEAENKKQAQDIKEAYAQATTGKPLVVINGNVLQGKQFNTLFQNVRNNFIAPEILELRRGIISAFLTEIGIRNVAVQKKERLTQGEYSENNDETKAIISVIYDNITSGFDTINSLSNLNLGVKLRYDYISSLASETVKEGENE